MNILVLNMNCRIIWNQKKKTHKNSEAASTLCWILLIQYNVSKHFWNFGGRVREYNGEHKCLNNILFFQTEFVTVYGIVKTLSISFYYCKLKDNWSLILIIYSCEITWLLQLKKYCIPPLTCSYFVFQCQYFMYNNVDTFGVIGVSTTLRNKFNLKQISTYD